MPGMEPPFKTPKHIFSNPPQSPFKKGGGRGLWPFLLVAAFAFLLYLNALGNGFVSDDFEQVLNNGFIRSPANIPEIFSTHMWGFRSTVGSNYYRPFIHLIYMASYFLFGLAAWGFHLVNILFHSATAGLVFLIARELLGEEGKSGFFSAPIIAPIIAGLLFASHPIHTEAVDWVSAISELSFSFFFLLSFYSFVKAGKEGLVRKGFHIASLLFFAVSLLCKETALMLPFVLLAYEHSFKRTGGRTGAARVKRFFPYLLLIIIYMGARTFALEGFLPERNSGGLDLTPFEQAINAFPLFAKYMGKLLFPVNLTGYDGSFITSLSGRGGYISLALTALFMALLFAAYKRNKEVFFPLAFMGLTLLPALYLRAIIGSTFAERYLYLPSFGFVLLFAVLIKKTGNLKAKKALYAGLLILISLYSVGTIARNPVWKDNLSFWSDTAAKSPRSDLAHNELGFALLNAGRTDEAIREFLTALRLNPDNYNAHCNLGIAYAVKGMTAEAIREFLISLRIEPGFAKAHFNLGVVYLQARNPYAAIKEFETALYLDPDYERARENLALALKMIVPSN